MFVDRVRGKIDLTIGTQTFSVPAGDIKGFELEMTPWGWKGRADFWLVSESDQSEDTLFASFLTHDLITIEMTLKRGFDEVEEAATALVVKGLVTEKSVTERSFAEIANQPVLQRKYTVRFADRGQVLWRQHFPNALYVDKTLQELVDDNKPTGVTLDHTWTASSTKHPVLSLGLGEAGNDASFYDFLGWLLSRTNAALYYDWAGDKYSIVDAKPVGLGEAEEIRKEYVESLETIFPVTRRATVTVLNGYTDAATKKKEIANAQSVLGVRKDYLIRSTIANDLTARVTLEKARAAQSEPTVRIALRSYPAVPLTPSMKVKLGEGFSDVLLASGKTFRVVSTRIAAEAESQVASDDTGNESNHYKLRYDLCVEHEADPVFHHPEFRRPTWPFHVEGKVLSEVGTETEGTYQAYRDDTTSLEFYKVKIPLWDDLKVIAPFEPTLLSGHFYFPLYKDERVLVALTFDTARIVSFLDWRPGARLPLDTQGNHILVGKGAKNQTSIQHAYEDAKPALTIARASSTDHQVIKVSEGTIRFETRDVE